MLSNPSTLFLNCLGSYFYSVVGYMENSMSGNSLLYFLAGNTLKYKELNPDEVYEKYADNPWGYQPLSIVNIDGNTADIDSRFFEYIKRMFNITIEKIEMTNNKALFDYLLCDNIDKFFHICKVDEYFLKSSQNFYMKKHNKHNLLIRKVNTEEQSIEIIDSEKNGIYTISFQELSQAFYENEFRTKIYIGINCAEFINNVDHLEIMQLYIESSHNTDYLTLLLSEMEKMLNSENDAKEYYYKGYRYTILSKILPMIEMKKYLFSRYPDKSFINLLNTLSSNWNELNTFMLYKIVRKDFSFQPLQTKLSEICKQEDKFNQYLIENSKKILSNYKSAKIDTINTR